MTKKELNGIIEKLLPNFPNFSSKGQLLFSQPVDGVLRGIFFDTSSNPRKFYVHVFIQLSFIPASHFVFNTGFRIGGSWDADVPNLIPELEDKIKKEAMPFLQTKNVSETIKSVRNDKDLYTQQAIAYLAVYQRDSSAVSELDRLISLLDSRIDWQKDMLDSACALKSDLKNPGEIRRKFLAWEKETFKNLGI